MFPAMVILAPPVPALMVMFELFSVTAEFIVSSWSPLLTIPVLVWIWSVALLSVVTVPEVVCVREFAWIVPLSVTVWLPPVWKKAASLFAHVVSAVLVAAVLQRAVLVFHVP